MSAVYPQPPFVQVFVDVHPQVKAVIFGPKKLDRETEEDVRALLRACALRALSREDTKLFIAKRVLKVVNKPSPGG